jgi:Ni,Fe-hydrogenase I small subunit
MKWNGGISYPIQSGHGCLGCSAPNFWDADSFYSRDLNILGGKVEESSDTIRKSCFRRCGCAGDSWWLLIFRKEKT